MEKNGTAGLAGDGACQQRFAGARRADQEKPFGTRAPRRPYDFGSRRNATNLLQLELRLLNAGNVLERHFGIGLDIDLRVRLADRHQSAETLFLGDATEHEHP